MLPGAAWLRSPLLGVALVVLHTALAVLLLVPQPHMGGDNAIYVSLARALLAGDGYVDLYDPLRPPHTQFPPVFPAVLALGLLAGLKPWLQLKLIVVAFSAAAVAFSWLWLRRTRAPEVALAAAAVLALSPGIAIHARWILSDVPFWALCMAALWALHGWRPGDHARLAVGIAAVVLAYFTRSAGLPLVAAVVLWFAHRRHWRALGVLVLVFAPLAAAWWLRTELHGDSSYVRAFMAADPYNPAAGVVDATGMLQRVRSNVARYFELHLPIVLFGGAQALQRLLAGVLVGCAFAGWVRRVRRPGPAELFLPLYVALVLVWPATWAGERFLLPVMPLLIAYAFDLVVSALRRNKGRRVPAVIAVTIVLLAAAAPGGASATRHAANCRAAAARDPDACLPAAEREFVRLARWAGEQLPPGSVVLSRKPTLFHAFSGHAGRVFPLHRDWDTFRTTAAAVGARYVLVDRLDGLSDRYLRPLVAENQAAFCAVRISGRSVLLGIVTDAAGEAVAGGLAQRVCVATFRSASPASQRH